MRNDMRNDMRRLKRTSTSDKVFSIIVIVVLVVSVLLAILPMLHILALSLSGKNAILSGRVNFWPLDFTTEAYQSVMKTPSILQSLVFTIILTVTCTGCCMFTTICAAYPLSKKYFVGRKLVTSIMIFTMYFSGGMIPDYLLMKGLGIKNTPAVLILPGLLSVYNMIIMRSFFTSIPKSLEESAQLDGASHWKILSKIVLPLSKPVLATLSLFYAVSRWNGFQDALIYITKPAYYPIQLKLYQIISNLSDVEIVLSEGTTIANSSVIAENIKAACMLVAIIPIMLVYPWIQRYFLSGVMIGAVKE